MTSLESKRWIIAGLGFLFLVSLIFVQKAEVDRRRREMGLAPPRIAVPETSKECVSCHMKSNPGIVDHWKGSTHALKGVACLECHTAEETDVDAFKHHGALIATIVTPRDCGRCHPEVSKEFGASHHAKAGDILASLDNFLAETVEGHRGKFNPHGIEADGMASARTGCWQCHGSKVGLIAKDGSSVTVDQLKPDGDGKPTVKIELTRDDDGKPKLDPGTWPNTGIGRLNLDGSKGSCTACHSRHDFSPRRARRPENCGKCHLGPDHPQKEIYEESKHGVAYRDLEDKMNLNADNWVLGRDYSAAPTCATCHMSGHSKNDGKITHDPGRRISWTNRPPVSKHLDEWEKRRGEMKDVCSHCHSPDFINSFYRQYDDFVTLYNEKFGKPGTAIMKALYDDGRLTKTQFDEEIEWTWFYLWHHEGRRARHGASMMAPDYAHWHGMYEVAERFYVHMIPQARALAKGSATAESVIEEIMARPEHVGRLAKRSH